MAWHEGLQVLQSLRNPAGLPLEKCSSWNQFDFLVPKLLANACVSDPIRIVYLWLCPYLCIILCLVELRQLLLRAESENHVCVCVTLLPTHFHPFPADSEEQGRNGRHRTLEALFHACGMPLLWSSRINQNCGITKNVSWKRYWYFALHPWVQRMCRLPALYCTPHIKVPGTLFAWNPEVEKNLTN